MSPRLLSYIPREALDEIELQERSNGDIIIHRYVINYDDKSYYYVGSVNPEEE